MIEVDHLTKRYGQFTAIEDISFNVSAGEVLGFLGPNGAGKTTTIKIISGFLTPTSGQVNILGKRVHSKSVDYRRNIGYLPEGAPSYADMTSLDFLLFSAEIRGFKGADKKHRVAEAMDKLSLQKVCHQTIETLSKGFRRRVGIAQAILHDPKILLLDEPTDGLDPNQKHQVRELIRELSSDKLIIISTHILEEVDAICSRAIIINKGRLVVDKTPAELEAMSEYHGAISVDFTSPAINFEKQLAQLPSVAKIIKKDDGATKVTLISRTDFDLLPQVNDLIKKNKWEISSIFRERGRLEETFRYLTEDTKE